MTLASQSPLTMHLAAMREGRASQVSIAREVIARKNGSASKNTYLWFSEENLLEQVHLLDLSVHETSLFGVPVSLKDCFDLRGTRTTGGSKFYAELNGPATQDSALAEVIHRSGALITGKTHLHALAYGITGQNTEYGDCLQPRDRTLLTGGSSSGAAASVQEGSALVGIGTDTGGSLRVPAALCGLVGYRASHGLAFGNGPWQESSEGLWAGGMHLAPSFDTPGFLLRDPRDAAPVAEALFGIAPESVDKMRIEVLPHSFLTDAEPEVVQAYRLWKDQLGASGSPVIDTGGWAESSEIFAGIQASEAAVIHCGHFAEFDAAIQQRLVWGAGLGPGDLAALRSRLAAFRLQMVRAFDSVDLLMMPCAPMCRLVAGEDQSKARTTILRYTTPFSLGGLPVIALPGELVGGAEGTGVQIAAAPGRDGALLGFAARVGEALAIETSNDAMLQARSGGTA